jgi:hypothetical protein
MSPMLPTLLMLLSSLPQPHLKTTHQIQSLPMLHIDHHLLQPG